jgi:hypothetical protein
MMDKLYIELSGRLGNQLHQICSGYSYAYQTNREPILETKRFHYQDSFTHTFECGIPSNGMNSYYPESFIYKPFNTSITGDLRMLGYNLSYKYHVDYAEKLLELFRLKENLQDWCNKIIKGTLLDSPCSIHIRRDDYVGNGYYYQLSEKYFRDAIDCIGDKSDGFIVFTDDLKWAKNIIPTLTNKKVFFSETNNPVVDLFAMSLCVNKILSNSSFSFFSAYFAEISKINKKVVYPSEWMYHTGFKLDDYCLPGWHKLQV